jgi:hypothetical protein
MPDSWVPKTLIEAWQRPKPIPFDEFAPAASVTIPKHIEGTNQR